MCLSILTISSVDIWKSLSKSNLYESTSPCKSTENPIRAGISTELAHIVTISSTKAFLTRLFSVSILVIST